MILKAIVAFDINLVTVILSSVIETIPGVSGFDADHEIQSDDMNQTEDELQSTLLKCQEVLESFQSLENNWEKRMDSLNENWESSRNLIFKSILCTGGLHMLGQFCAICAEGKCDVRCIECGGKKMCSKCDATPRPPFP